MPPPVRERYNAKARGSTAGGSSHKNRKRGKAVDPNRMGKGGAREEWAGIVDEENGDERPAPVVQQDPGMSSKKRKRLDSYIAKKLKSEQRAATISLIASHAPTSTAVSQALLSTATLGQNPMRPSSAKERLAREEDRNVRRGIAAVKRRGIDVADETDDEPEGRPREKIVEVVRTAGVEPEEEGVKATVIPQRNKKLERAARGKGVMPRKTDWNTGLLPTQPQPESDFDSSDSANDTEDEPMPEAGPSKPRSTSPAPAFVATGVALKTAASSSTGGALKRNADGSVVMPKVIPRKMGKKLLGRNLRRGDKAAALAEEEEEEEESYDESDNEGSEDEDMSEGDDEDGDEDEEDSGEEDEDEDEDEDGSSEDDAEPEPPVKKRALGFKDWALSQMGQPTPPSPPDLDSEPFPKPVVKSKPRDPNALAIGPLGEDFRLPEKSLLSRTPSAAVNKVDLTKPRPTISRRPDVDEARMGLPIVAEEQNLIEAVLLHPVVIVCGETGSGKTTQMPQMLYEAGFGFKESDNPGMIAVTQPRRVAAVSLAVRVADELNIPANSALVAHQIRYSSTTSPQTAIKFMTDGVILRELAQDFLLSKYSVVVVDEAHERGVNTDVLIGVLSRVAKLREKLWREGKDEIKPLRIVIMSATLRVSDFAENTTLFATPPPIIHIPARQHPVTVHFNRRTPSDYVTEAYKKTVKIHARLPPGGILIFMTGQGEIQALCRKLEKRFGKQALADKKKRRGALADQSSRSREDARRFEEGEEAEPPKVDFLDADVEAEDFDLGGQDDLAADVDDGDADSDPEALDSDADDDIDERLGIDAEESEVPMHILPLYSLLPNEQQMLVFKDPPADSRLVIVATNVAETSLTIPGIKYVVDSGRAKERHYDHASGVQAFQVSWISKASASQRAGRAGRTGPGHCYRLYSSALYEDHFAKFSQPEILRMPIEGIVLQMKGMNIDAVVNFPFPTPPDRQSLRRAEELLTHLGALEPTTRTKMVHGIEKAGTIGGRITDLGKAMSTFPVSPRFAKMLVIGQQHGCLPYIISIVAGLSVGDPFLREQALGLEKGDEGEDEAELNEAVPELRHIRDADIRGTEERKEQRRRFFKTQQQYAALGDAASDMFKLLAVIGAYEFDGGGATFCARNFVRPKAMQEIQQLRSQITSIAKTQLPENHKVLAAKLTPPNAVQLKVIRQVLTAGFIDQVAVRKDLVQKTGGTKYESTRGIAYRALGVTEDVFIHPSSSIFHGAPPDFVVFQEVVRTSRVWIKGLTKINPVWLSSLGKSLCSFSRPLEPPKGAKAAALQREKEGDVREVFVTPHFKDLGVDLPAIKMKQRREGARWVVVE